MFIFRTRRNSELLEAFEMLDADGDGKVIKYKSLKETVNVFKKTHTTNDFQDYNLLQVSFNDLQTVLTKISYCGQIEDGTLRTILRRAGKTKSGVITFDVSC